MNKGGRSPTPPQAGTFLVRYWRGELSLPLSSGVAAVSALLGLFILGLASRLHGSLDFHPVTMLVLALVPLGPVVLLLIWQVAGLWRSAGRHALQA